MKLNKDQIEQLHYHINGKLTPYIEVRDEVLDHYQTALELEEEKTMEEVLKELDQTFTIDYCKKIAKNYIHELKSEYPFLLKNKIIFIFLNYLLFDLFQNDSHFYIHPIFLLVFYKRELQHQDVLPRQPQN